MARHERVASASPVQAGADPDAATADLLRAAAELAIGYRASLPARRVGVDAGLTVEDLRARLHRPLPEEGEDPQAVVEALARDVEPGLIAMPGPRYFGFVIGGAVPAALAADWLTSTWDQNTALYLATPSAAVVEEVVARWLVELLGLPVGTSVGFTTGATMANLTAIAAARHRVLRAAGWDVEEDGLQGAPRVEVVVGADAHVSLLAALRMIGLGRGHARRVATDDHGRMLADDLQRTVRDLRGPTIVCAQAGEVNTGAFDPLDAVAGLVAELPNAWLHVDGAFGLWAATSPRLRHLVAGCERADSWSADAHKWLNVPYDSGLVFVRDAAAHRAAMGMAAAYLPPAPGAERDPFDYVPEMSRRARGFALYAALRSLGRSGVVEMVERCCALARRMAERLAAYPGIAILNDVDLNQLLARFADDDATTREVIARVQADGTCWLGGTTWRGRAAMRISVSNWSTTADDIDRSAAAIMACFDAALRSSGARGS